MIINLTEAEVKRAIFDYLKAKGMPVPDVRAINVKMKSEGDYDADLDWKEPAPGPMTRRK